ncbi:hypothetical protein, partial [Stenotrophomonas maltophilia]
QDGGVLASRDGLRLNGAELFNGNGGLLSSQQSIDVILDGVLGNQAGSLSSQGRLSVKSGRLDNQGGAVSSAGTLSLSSQGALNNQGGRV